MSAKMWNFLGGLRFTGSGNSKPFGQILVGSSTVTASATSVSTTMNAFTIAPGVGVDIMRSGSTTGVRLQGSYLLMRNSGAWGHGMTFGVGISFGAGK